MPTPTSGDIVRYLVHRKSDTTFGWQRLTIRRPLGNAPDAVRHDTCETCAATVPVTVLSEANLAAAQRRRRTVGVAALIIPVALWGWGVSVEWFDGTSAFALPLTIALTVIGVLVGALALLQVKSMDGISVGDAGHNIGHLAFDSLACERCGYTTEDMPKEIDVTTLQEKILERRAAMATHACPNR